jgi:hypothetical protein
VAEVWDQLPSERKAPYEKFLAFLQLGPFRSLSELARQKNVTAEGLRYLSNKFDWNNRAAAWDASGGVPSKALPPPPKPQKVQKPPPPPQSLDLNRVIEPEVVETIRTNPVPDHKDQMIAYRDAFKDKGTAMLALSDKAQQLAEMAHADLEKSWELRQKALDAGDIAAANLYCKGILDMTPCFWRYCEAVRGLANDASTHWGNATGISELLKRVYG